MGVIVETDAGRNEGVQVAGAVVYKGIPHAASPAGKGRWQAPQPVEPWSGVRTAAAFSPIAPQNLPEDSVFGADRAPEPQSEDCLYLNIWTPNTDSADRPVMVWIHGGAFVMGSGSSPMYDGRKLAGRGDVVIVTVNYRLGPFGFLNLKEVTGGELPAGGNEGMLDILAALEWVKRNIRAFGGDPGNVTVFGESAGGMAIGALLAMPAAKGLFHKAILQSGSNTVHPYDRSVRVAERFLSILGKENGDAAALRSLTTEQWLAATTEATIGNSEIGVMPMQPTVDGQLLPATPIDALAQGSAQDIPILIGSNLEEWKLFSQQDPTIEGLDDSGLIERLGASSVDWEIGKVVESYRKTHAVHDIDTSAKALFSAIQTDRVYRMPALRMLESQQKHGQASYNYLFTWPSPLLDGIFGACHALEIGFLFGNIEEAGASAFCGSGPEADLLSERIQDAWLAFARTGDPSCDSLGAWQAYGKGRETMLLGRACGLQAAPYEDLRRAWDSVPDSVLGFL